ncbi:LacI family DNA-binding transcriptional regulator [Novosphingobium flavum]|uniref:LacI family DNA-binding transcriptional regulator n=1 Tax=Novosphingobium aerophilum TaxID=2839843 RepID=UPI00163A1E23|nr:LacI family DNA-binding transcriptional regulator [Novosphingobium aerophilum]MBC2662347.1 LacI family DNA-binding transcriptional regulator [Novosphingobium aerophilum]
MIDEAAPKPRRLRNIAELAKLAGVSAGTVSRALAGKGLVRAETRERIQALAREHGFRPNQMASGLRTGQTGVIGIAIPLGHEQGQHISDPFFMSLLGNLADTLVDRGYDIILRKCLPNQDPDWLDRLTDSGMVDGVLLIGQSDQFETIERVAASYLPLVVWGTYRQNQTHCAVGTDSFAGGQLAANHLLSSGKQRIVFLGDTRGLEIERRLAGARAALEAAQAPHWMEHYAVPLSADQMAEAIGSALEVMDPRTDAIFAASDLIAMTAIRLLHERNRSVPGDIAVIGFDDLPVAEQTTPQLTTIKQDVANGARAMASCLMRRMRGETVPSQTMPARLILRGSA